MNDALHWNKIAPDYDKEIFNVFQSDRKKKLKKYLSDYANRETMAIDFGCGVGKALPLLSPLFKEIIAVDVSSKCIEKAKSTPHNSNVTFKVMDLAGKNVAVPSVDFAFCCNVAMSDDVKRNRQIINNVLRALNKNGVAMFVLPSLESVSTSALRLIDWYRKDSVAMNEIPKDELDHFAGGSEKHISQGIVAIDNVPTKHYLFTELYSMFNTGKYSMLRIDRLEYDWNTEFESPPSWMQAPYPWDWIVEVKRVK